MNRLKELRKEKKLTQKELAGILKINEKTISRWENNESTIKSNKAETLANYFNVSIGYLLGFTDKRTLQDELVHSRENIQEQFKKETDALLSLGALLSDHDINSILDFINRLSSKNKELIHTKIENNDKFLEDYFEDEFFSFSEKYPDYISKTKKEYQEHLEQISTMTDEERRLIALHLNEIYSNIDRRL